MQYRKYSLDPLLVTAGTLALTERIILISTVHALYGWHPLHLAKMGATLDHMTGGRWGLKLVTGFRPHEIRMFGLDSIPHNDRYVMAAEFTELMQTLWREERNVTAAGRPPIAAIYPDSFGSSYAPPNSFKIFGCSAAPIRRSSSADISMNCWSPVAGLTAQPAQKDPKPAAAAAEKSRRVNDNRLVFDLSQMLHSVILAPRSARGEWRQSSTGCAP